MDETALLLQNSEKFRSLYHKHQSLESRLQQIDGRHYLHAREELEKRVLKKQKLLLKDQMVRLRRTLHPGA